MVITPKLVEADARDYDVDYHIGHFVLGMLYVGG